MKSKQKALARYGRVRRETKQVYHKNHKVNKKPPLGSGHRAGEGWGEKKDIDPESPVRKYSKRSPSFDQGVDNYKRRAHNKALTEAKINKFFKK